MVVNPFGNLAGLNESVPSPYLPILGFYCPCALQPEKALGILHRGEIQGLEE